MKRTVILIIIASILAAGGYLVWRNTVGDEQPTYLTARAEFGDISEVVSESGTVTVDDRELYFEGTGTVEGVSAAVGEHVEMGDELLRLDASILAAQSLAASAKLAAAEARLTQLNAGSTVEALKVAATNVDNAELALAKAEQELSDARLTVDEQVALKEVALSAKQTAYDNAVATAEQDLEAVQESAADIGREAMVSVSVALSDADRILGVDNETGNDDFVDDLAVENTAALAAAVAGYDNTKTSRDAAESALDLAASEYEATLTAISLSEAALDNTLDMLNDIIVSLEATVATANITQAEIDEFLTLVNTDRAAVSEQMVAVGEAEQELRTTQVGNDAALDAALDAVATAEQDLTAVSVETDGEVNLLAQKVTLAKGDLKKAQDEFARVAASPRAVDAAILEAEILAAEAEVARTTAEIAKTVIRAPAAGTVAELPLKEGEAAGPAVLAAVVIVDNGFDIEVNVSELDVRRLDVGDRAELYVEALDASSPAIVRRVDPREMLIDADVFYKVVLAFEGEPPAVRSGMGADVSIITDKKGGVLTVPERAVFRKQGRETVRVVKNGGVEERQVSVGLRGLDDVEIVSGLSEGDEVVVGERR